MKDKEKTKNQPISKPTKRKQILIVEDERVVAKDIKMSVQKLGYAVSGIVFSGEDAVKKAEELHPDLVLMDIVLEGKMNGMDAAEIIRSRFNIPIVYLTAHSDKNTLERAKQTEPYGYILKPFDNRDLSITVEMALYKHKMEKSIHESEERYRSLYDSSKDGLVSAGLDGHFIECNQAFADMLGYTKEEIYNLTYKELTPSKWHDIDAKLYAEQMIPRGYSDEYEKEYIKKDGTIFPVSLRAWFIEDKEGNRTGTWAIIRDITERNKTEKALKKSEDSLIQAQKIAQIGSWEMDAITKKLVWSKQMYNILEVKTDEEPIFELYYSRVHPDDLAYVQEIGARVLKKNEAAIAEYRLLTPSKTIKYVATEGRQILDKKNNVIKLTGIVQDITERKKAQEALKESEEFNVALFQHNPIQTIAVDNSGKVANFNMVKKTSGDRLPNIGDVMYKDYAGKHEINMHAELMECIKSKKEKRFPEMKYRDKYLDITLAPFPQGAIITTQDITERKKTNEALKESEERYKDLVEKAGIGILIDDRKGNIKYFNEKYMEILGYSRKETKKLSIQSIVHPDDVEKVLKYHKNRIQGRRTPTRYEFRAIRKDRSIINLEVDAVTLRENGKITGSRSYTWNITERKKAEKKLKQRTHELNERIKELSCLYKIDDISRREGTTIEEVLKKTVFIIPPSWQYPEITGSRIALEGKEYKTNNFKKTKWMQKSDIVVNDKNAGFVEICCLEKRPDASEGPFSNEGRNLINAIAERISQLANREKTETALYNSEEKYRTLTENVNVGVYRNTTKPDGKFIEANPAFIKIFGYKNRDDMLATRILNIYQIPEDRKKFIEKLLRDGFVRNEELKLKKKDGSPIICSVSAVTIKDKKGKAKYYDGIIENITKRKLAEEAMRKSEMTYRALFESGNDPVILFSLNGIIVSSNKKAAEILGYNVEELIGMSYKDIIASYEIKDAGDKLKSLQEGKAFFPYERTAYKKNGTEFPSEVNLSLVQDENNKPVFLQSIFRDITERKRADEELKTSREQLRNLAAHLQAVREGERTSIAREIHDDLGQTMTALKMDLSLLGTKLPKDQESLLKKTKSMSKLIDSTIQTVQRISAELRPGVLDDIGLTAALEWQGGEFQKRTGIKCELTVDPEDFFLEKDHSTAIFRIFQETLTNVARHSKAKWVKVNLKKKALRLELKIRDNGRGITEEQISNSKSFGLIGIRERVQFLGGEVEIRGIQNRGTTLKAWIPLPKDKKN